MPRLDIVVETIEEIRRLADGLDVTGLGSENQVKTVAPDMDVCAFCMRKSFSATHLVGTVIQVEADTNTVIPVHDGCASWNIDVYPDRRTGKLLNVSTGVRRARLRLCVHCKKLGASLGCSKKSCPRNYHLPCAVGSSKIVLDDDSRELWCPEHIDLAPLACDNGSDDVAAIFSQGGTEERCTVCKRRGGDLLCCDTCEKSVHLRCNDPPLEAAPLEVWHCSGCAKDDFEAVNNNGRSDEVVIMHTGLEPSQRAELVRVCGRLGTRVVTDVLSEVTHVVTGAKSTTELPRRTGKLLKAIVSGKFIVTFAWIAAAAASRKKVWPKAFAFELDGQAKKVRSTGLRIFGGHSFYFGAYKLKVPAKEDLQEMVVLGGGRILKRVPTKKDGISFVVRDKRTSTKKIRIPLAPSGRGHHTVDGRWIMDRIMGDA
eukprot:CAMPEP_0198736374 /NCGR_PEP_ID=MMETSP1475-20131203/65378_1 /TAXON_ID= ORGANISM="Unidentified sp., Strain CCMP1999" /NCGR_SAMPLE_ID=MMETSP1475 /ASSEMBLY_ACC=CAM_ASM_001111 /LENGTH=427 /DNA_ID=CAMNT_0044500177 /DNA_START=184 /DNA_END=1467 /DNA_ORIENTATION=-